MYKLLVIFFILILLVGGNRGAKSFIVLGFNMIISLFSFYLINLGLSILVILPLCCLLFCVITIFYQNEYSKKTLASFLSVILLLLVLSLIILLICSRAHIVGINEVEKFDDSILYISSAVNLQMRYVLLMSLILAQLGAIIDTSISLTSAMNEVHSHNPALSRWELFHSGMLVGHDILGTTINTLTFVAISQSVMLVLVYMGYHYSAVRILNSKSFFQELSCVVISCIGCILIIPLSVLIFSFLSTSPSSPEFERNKSEKSKEK